jgi:hypothetical protein
MRSTYHTTLQTPGQLVFGRDMLLSIPFRADWAQIKIRKQGLINKRCSLRKRFKNTTYKYNVGDKVLLDKPGILRKSTQPRTRPHIPLQEYIRIVLSKSNEMLELKELLYGI